VAQPKTFPFELSAFGYRNEGRDYASVVNQQAPAQHPLDPCSADELRAAVRILNETGSLGPRTFFACGHAAEPTKTEMQAHESGQGQAPERRIVIIGHDRDRSQSFHADISLDHQRLDGLSWIEQGQAPINHTDLVEVNAALRQNADWLAALAARGIDDLSLVHIEPWPAGIHPPNLTEGRVFRALTFTKNDPEDNHYAHPVEGLIASVDADSGEVVVEDHGIVAVPTTPAPYAAERIETMREAPKPLEITQPDGPSFDVDGQVVTWQGWTLRLSVHPIEGLVLHDVRYRDGERDRPILYRAALSDMVVPYGDPSPLHFWKHAFDAGETALGHQANSLELGCDCLGEITYFDAVMLGADGEPYTVTNAVCLHEEDFGILWKHTNVFQPEQRPEVRRSRRLVVSMIHTVGNYEYGFFWYFYLDGTIQMEVKLTGIIGVSAVDPALGAEAGSGYAPLVAPGITSPIHQHLFCFRLDFDLDGVPNSVIESDVEVVSGDHPYQAGFRRVATTLRTEGEAQRTIDPARSRSWQVVGPSSINALGNPVAYKLLPQASPTLLAPPESPSGRRGGFAKHNLWVTPYDPQQHWAGAGPFSNLHPGGDGLPAYVEADRSVEETDVVVWHTFGVTHVPRPEDWPVMPVEYAGFTLMPNGFFDQNPAMDVPPSDSACHP
jgi:primary-amine oxidase